MCVRNSYNRPGIQTVAPHVHHRLPGSGPPSDQLPVGSPQQPAKEECLSVSDPQLDLVLPPLELASDTAFRISPVSILLLPPRGDAEPRDIESGGGLGGVTRTSVGAGLERTFEVHCGFGASSVELRSDLVTRVGVPAALEPVAKFLQLQQPVKVGEVKVAKFSDLERLVTHVNDQRALKRLLRVLIYAGYLSVDDKEQASGSEEQ